MKAEERAARLALVGELIARRSRLLLVETRPRPVIAGCAVLDLGD